jgi:hypothetical protein
MIMSYQIDKSKGHTAPEKFTDEHDGSWILGYKIVNTDVYNKFKSGEVRGFSIEGVFILDEFEFSKERELMNAIDSFMALLKK